MTFLPIVARELRVASRRRGTYWVRSGAGLALLAFATWFFLMLQRESPQAMSEGLFILLTGAATLYALLCGVRSTADCLSLEKREGTLGLLFLTDLKGYDVVFGKLVANSLNAFYGVLAIVPMLAIPLLMGGITLDEFGRMALVTVNTLFFSLCMGIFASAASRSARSAMGLTFLLIVFFAGVLPGLGAWLDFVGKAAQVNVVFLLPSPGFTYARAFDMFYKTAPRSFWWSLGVVDGLAWLSLVCACFIVPRTWQDRPAGIQRLRWRERWRLWSYGNLEERVAFRRRLLDQSAFFWLAARARLKPALVWGTLGMLTCGWVWGLLKYRNDWLNEGTYVITGLVLCLLLKGWVASEAGRQFAEDRAEGALELLLSTPLTVQDIVHGQFLALKRQFLGPVLVVLCVCVVFMFAGGTDLSSEEDRTFSVHLWGAGMVILVADLVALYWVGMWQGLTARNPNRAASASLARILVLPWVAFALVVLAISLVAMNRRSDPKPEVFLRWWFGLGLAADIGFGAWARFRLLTQFRLIAERRYSRRLWLWNWLLPKPVPPGETAPRPQA